MLNSILLLFFKCVSVFHRVHIRSSLNHNVQFGTIHSVSIVHAQCKFINSLCYHSLTIITIGTIIGCLGHRSI